MPKIKTSKGALKRFRKTAKGNIRRRKAGLRHLLTSKKKSRKKRLGRTGEIAKTHARSIKRLMPYL